MMAFSFSVVDYIPHQGALFSGKCNGKLFLIVYPRLTKGRVII